MRLVTALDRSRWMAIAGICTGFVLHTYTAVFKAEGGLDSFLIGLLLLSWLPYAICALLLWRQRVAMAAGAAALMLAADGWAYYSAFLNPQGSTSALILLFMPLWNLFVIGPTGGVLAWFGLRRRRRVEALAPPSRTR